MNAKKEEVRDVYNSLIDDIEVLKSVLKIDPNREILSHMLVCIEENDLKTAIDVCIARLKRIGRLTKM